MGDCVETRAEFVVCGYRAEEGGGPYHCEQDQAGNCRITHSRWWRCDKCYGSSEFDQHRQYDDQASLFDVSGMPCRKLCFPDTVKQWVMHDVDEPDEAGQEPGCGKMYEEQFHGGLRSG